MSSTSGSIKDLDIECISIDDIDPNETPTYSTKKQPKPVYVRDLRDLRETQNMAKKFIGNFDPEKSAREKRKLTRKLSAASKRYANAKFDERGIHIQARRDLCDCLVESCRGCFYPCSSCKSSKCGAECRRYRKYAYEAVDYEGENFRIRNPFASART